MTTSAIRRVREEMGEFFLLKETSRINQGRSGAQQEAVRKYYQAGFRRMQAAQLLRGPDLAPAALSLYREAGYLLAIAFLLSRDETVDPSATSPDSAFQRLAETLANDGRDPPANWSAAEPFLISQDPLQLDRLSGDESEHIAANLEATTKWIAELVDPRSPKELKVTSLVRIIIGVTLCGALLVALGITLFKPKNLAALRPANSSTVALSTSPAGAVDGSRSEHFGFHSAEEESPWWSVDLGQPISVKGVTVYGRDDCCYDQSIPLALEISDDGANYRKIGERTQPFGDANPWVFRSTDRAVGRFVRLRSLRKTYLVLGEVEVYGHPMK